jgi:hypothetical protein
MKPFIFKGAGRWATNKRQRQKTLKRVHNSLIYMFLSTSMAFNYSPGRNPNGMASCALYCWHSGAVRAEAGISANGSRAMTANNIK